MKVDTGATLSVISETTYNSLWVNQASPPLQLCDGQLKIHRPTIGMGSHEMLLGTPPPPPPNFVLGNITTEEELGGRGMVTM